MASLVYNKTETNTWGFTQFCPPDFCTRFQKHNSHLHFEPSDLNVLDLLAPFTGILQMWNLVRCQLSNTNYSCVLSCKSLQKHLAGHHHQLVPFAVPGRRQKQKLSRNPSELLFVAGGFFSRINGTISENVFGELQPEGACEDINHHSICLRPFSGKVVVNTQFASHLYVLKITLWQCYLMTQKHLCRQFDSNWPTGLSAIHWLRLVIHEFPFPLN